MNAITKPPILVAARAWADYLRTYNECPYCGAHWREAVTIPGVLHQTKVCARPSCQQQHTTKGAA